MAMINSVGVLFFLSFVKVHVLPVDSSRPCTYYCCKAQEPRSTLSFNEGFQILLPAGGALSHALHLQLCALGPLGHDELLVRRERTHTVTELHNYNQY